jgi:alcohol dehydrogenase
MLPAVIRFNAEEPKTRAIYGELALGSGLLEVGRDPAAGPDALVDFIQQYRGTAGLPGTLADAGVHDPDIEDLAAEASRQWTGRFNPRPPSVEDFVRMYESVAGNRIHEPVETMP